MRPRRFWACLWIPLVATGCFLQRGGVGDAGAPLDSDPPRPDVSAADATTRDASVPRDAGHDASPMDAFVPLDAPAEPDATVPDATVPDTGPDCVVVSTTVCVDELVDEDCDGVTDEGCDCAETFAGEPCATGVTTCGGAIACSAGGPVCESITSTPVCNASDDDCDGTIDEGSGCGASGSADCTPYVFAGSSYLFCDFGATFAEARMHCMAYGYDLATIEGPTEDGALEEFGSSIDFNERWLVGYEDLDDDGAYRWVRGSSSYEGPNFPNQSGECAVIDSGDEDWGGANCGFNNSFICEVDPD